MKKLFILLFALSLFSCTEEASVPITDCESNSIEINAHFDAQIDWVEENTSPVDVRQIELINEERYKALENACE